jgi:hypothetical protein
LLAAQSKTVKALNLLLMNCGKIEQSQRLARQSRGAITSMPGRDSDNVGRVGSAVEYREQTPKRIEGPALDLIRGEVRLEGDAAGRALHPVDQAEIVEAVLELSIVSPEFPCTCHRIPSTPHCTQGQ